MAIKKYTICKKHNRKTKIHRGGSWGRVKSSIKSKFTPKPFNANAYQEKLSTQNVQVKKLRKYFPKMVAQLEKTIENQQHQRLENLIQQEQQKQQQQQQQQQQQPLTDKQRKQQIILKTMVNMINTDKKQKYAIAMKKLQTEDPDVYVLQHIKGKSPEYIMQFKNNRYEEEHRYDQTEAQLQAAGIIP
jgi:hypothetical protein